MLHVSLFCYNTIAKHTISFDIAVYFYSPNVMLQLGKTCVRQATSLDLGPLHTQDWEHVTIALQALSSVKQVEPVQVCFTMLDGPTEYVNGRWM